MCKAVLLLCLTGCAASTFEQRRSRALDNECAPRCVGDVRGSYSTLAKFREPDVCVCWTPGAASWEIELTVPAAPRPNVFARRAP